MNSKGPPTQKEVDERIEPGQGLKEIKFDDSDLEKSIDWSEKNIIQTYYSLWDKSRMRFNINTIYDTPLGLILQKNFPFYVSYEFYFEVYIISKQKDKIKL